MFRNAPLRLPTGEAHENGTQGFGRGTTGYVSLAVKTAERLTRVTCALALLASLALSRVAAAGETTSYQGNPAHDGTVAGETLQPPLSVRWQRQLGGEAKPSMVVADGIVAVITPATASGPEPLSLTVLDQADGHVLWTATARADADEASVAYADHTLYFADEYGSVTAFSDKTGAVKWTAAGEGLFYWGTITVADGLVFLTRDDSGGDVYVLDAATGQPRWSMYQPANPNRGAAAFADHTLYTAFDNPETAAFDPATGAVRWKSTTTGDNGGSLTPSVAGGRLYRASVFDSSAFDATTGAHLFDYQTTTTPAIAGTTMLIEHGAELASLDAATGTQRWTAAIPPEDSGPAPSPPLVVNGIAYVGTRHGTVYAFDPADGHIVTSFSAGTGYIPILGAGQGLLVVPSDGLITAFGQSPTATPTPTHSPVSTVTATPATSPAPSPQASPTATTTPLPTTAASEASPTPVSADAPASPTPTGPGATAETPARLRIRVPASVRRSVLCATGITITLRSPRDGNAAVRLSAGYTIDRALATITAGTPTKLHLHPTATCAINTERRGQLTIAVRTGYGAIRARRTIRIRR